LKTLSALLLVFAVTLDFTAVTAAADPPRKANTILSNPVVWKSNDLRELVRSGGLSSTDIAALSGGREGLPWGIQASNKRLCADEKLAATPARGSSRPIMWCLTSPCRRCAAPALGSQN
jgi:hypothetical protein